MSSTDCDKCGGYLDYLPRLKVYKCRECREYGPDGPPAYWPPEPDGMNCGDCLHTPCGKCSKHRRDPVFGQGLTFNEPRL